MIDHHRGDGLFGLAGGVSAAPKVVGGSRTPFAIRVHTHSHILRCSSSCFCFVLAPLNPSRCSDVDAPAADGCCLHGCVPTDDHGAHDGTTTRHDGGGLPDGPDGIAPRRHDGAPPRRHTGTDGVAMMPRCGPALLHLLDDGTRVPTSMTHVDIATLTPPVRRMGRARRGRQRRHRPRPHDGASR